MLWLVHLRSNSHHSYNELQLRGRMMEPPYTKWKWWWSSMGVGAWLVWSYHHGSPDWDSWVQGGFLLLVDWFQRMTTTKDEPFICTTLSKTTLKWFQMDMAPSHDLGKGHSRSTTIKKKMPADLQQSQNVFWEILPFADFLLPCALYLRATSLFNMGGLSPTQYPTFQTCSFSFLSLKQNLYVLYCSLLLHDSSWESNLC